MHATNFAAIINMKLTSILFIFCFKVSFLGSAIQLSSCDNSIDTSNQKRIPGKVIAIIDGDTYDLLVEGKKTVRVRMEGIDAPERGMPYYRVAKQYLGSLCFGKTVILQVTGIDNHGRYLGFTYLDDGRELSHEMIKAGMAWHFKKYSSDKVLAKLELEARDAKRGLWKDKNPMSPWRNRSLHRQGISTKDSFNVR